MGKGVCLKGLVSEFAGTQPHVIYAAFTHSLMSRWNYIGVNCPDLGGTVLNFATVSRRPALLASNPDFTKLLTATVRTGMHNHLPVHFATPIVFNDVTLVSCKLNSNCTCLI